MCERCRSKGRAAWTEICAEIGSVEAAELLRQALEMQGKILALSDAWRRRVRGKVSFDLLRRVALAMSLIEASDDVAEDAAIDPEDVVYNAICIASWLKDDTGQIFIPLEPSVH